VQASKTSKGTEMTVRMPTAEEIQKWSPKARPDYIKAFLNGEAFLREAGILDTQLDLCHFMGQTGAETNGWTIVRENMNFISVESIRRTWPARAKKHTTAWINMNLVRKPQALSDWAYGGRMGNKKGGPDGYNFRGGGFLQTTGRYHVEWYAKKLGLPMNDLMLDDAPTTLRFACFEWKNAQCGYYAKKNDLLAVSKIINTGGAHNGVMPNGMPHRKAWFAKAWKIWGDPNRPTVAQATDVTRKTLKEQGSGTVKAGEKLENIGTAVSGTAIVVKVAKETGLIETAEPVETTKTVIEKIQEVGDGASILTSAGQSLKAFGQFVYADFWLIAFIAGCVSVYLGWDIIKRRVTDARMGLHTGRIPEESDPDPVSDSAEPVGAR
jgi:predicted chitinase